MSDQPGPAPAADTPTPDAPGPDLGTPGSDQQQTTAQEQAVIDYQKRYEDLRPQYTQATQRLSQYEQLIQALHSDDPDTRSQAAQALGVEFADDTDADQEYQDPTDVMAQRLEALERQIAERDQLSQQEQQIAQVEQYVDQALGQLDGVTDRAKDWIAKAAFAAPGIETPDGLIVPDIQAAHQAYLEWRNEEQKNWASSKQAHHISAVGGEGTVALDQISDPEARREAMVARMAQLEQMDGS